MAKKDSCCASGKLGYIVAFLLGLLIGALVFALVSIMEVQEQGEILEDAILRIESIETSMKGWDQIGPAVTPEAPSTESAGWDQIDAAATPEDENPGEAGGWDQI